jgi:hypothetical protein
MRLSWPRTRRGSALVAALAASLVTCIAVATATAFAAATDQQIHGCVSNGLAGIGKGAIRIVNDPSQCSAVESAVSWNQQGPAGPPGPQGSPGPQGPKGDGGAAEEWATANATPVDVCQETAAGCATFVPLAAWDLPAGSYLLFASTNTSPYTPGAGDKQWGIQCLLRSAGKALPGAVMTMSDTATVNDVGGYQAVQLPPTPLTLSQTTHVEFDCTVGGGFGFDAFADRATVRDSSAEAVKLGIVHTS